MRRRISSASVRPFEAAVVALSYAVGSIPFSNLVARVTRNVDLRQVGTGTVSTTGLYRIAGFGPAAVAGSLDVAKGAIGPLLAGRDRPILRALAGGMAVAGHNWSPFLQSAGGRGISPAMGALAVNSWPGVVVLAAGLAGGRLARKTSIGCFFAYLALVPILSRIHGRRGAVAGVCVLIPIVSKRLAGNSPPQAGRSQARVLLNRLVRDQDESPPR
jgi:glycerol-3-phosphate acyltransferase PlsY